jgi:hypothetical protein
MLAGFVKILILQDRRRGYVLYWGYCTLLFEVTLLPRSISRLHHSIFQNLSPKVVLPLYNKAEVIHYFFGLYSMFGAPAILHSDNNDREFHNQVIDELLYIPWETL